jgi:hypothetical protein
MERQVVYRETPTNQFLELRGDSREDQRGRDKEREGGSSDGELRSL